MYTKQQRTGGKADFAVYPLYQVSLFFGFCQGKKTGKKTGHRRLRSNRYEVTGI
jgi:hypothetical protein